MLVKHEEMMGIWRDKVYAIRATLTLTEWESNFISSLSDRLSKDKELTMQQSIALNNIYRRVG
jgi:hypothetical protein